MDRIRDTLAREARILEEQRDHPRRSAGRPKKAPGEKAQVYAIRIPAQRLGELRRIADDDGVPPTVMMRAWILERLAKEQRAAGSSSPVKRLVRGTRTVHRQRAVAVKAPAKAAKKATKTPRKR